MSCLKNQVAIITGGGSGIGFAIAEAVAAENMAIVICGRNENKLNDAATRLKEQGGEVLAVRANVAVGDQVDGLVRRAVDAFGRIDLLVNNAGIGQSGLVTDLSEAEWDQVQSINLKGTFLSTRAVFPVMKRQRSGYIINISSVAGKEGFGGASAYSASKFGMIGFTQSILEESIPYNIKATVICPGFVATPLVSGASVPPEEMIPPGDIGKLVVVLLHLSPVTVIQEVVVQRKGAIET